MSKYLSIYLGDIRDPKPVFRDEDPGLFAWPEGSVFAVAFRPGDFQGVAAHIRKTLPSVEFFGTDGWPVEMPLELKAALPPILKLEFQVHPWGWRSFSERDWARVKRDPELLPISRQQAGFARALLPLLSPLEHTVSDS